MPFKFFGEANPELDKENKIVTKIFDHVDVKTFIRSIPLVSKQWKEVVEKKSPDTRVLLQLLSQCSPFKDEETSSITAVEKLSGGLTNTTFSFKHWDIKLIGRRPGKNSDMLIDRDAEAFNAKLLEDIQLGPEVIYTNRKGIQITKFLENFTPIKTESMNSTANLKGVAEALKKLHTCGKEFANDVDVFARNKHMLKLLLNRGITLPNEYFLITEQMDALETVFQSLQIQKIPCHNDTTSSNFMKSIGEIKLIDPEYSGNNDPLWDLACLSMEAHFTEEQDKRLLSYYFDTDNADETLYQRFILYKPVVEFWAALWYQIQIANDNLQDTLDNLKNSERSRFSQCQELLNSTDFKQALYFIKPHSRTTELNQTNDQGKSNPSFSPLVKR